MMMKRAGIKRLALRGGVVAVLLAVFALYLQPNFALALATQLWNCL